LYSNLKEKKGCRLDSWNVATGYNEVYLYFMDRYAGFTNSLFSSVTKQAKQALVLECTTNLILVLIMSHNASLCKKNEEKHENEKNVK